jgi:hypothetical protein
MATGHGEKLARKQEQAVASLLQHATVRAAAAAVPINERTLREWMRHADFAAAYHRARREVLDGAVGRMQAAAGTAVDTLLAVARDGGKDADRVRASIALLDIAFRGLAEADILRGMPEADAGSAMDTGDVVELLAARLRQVDQSELPTGEKSRVTASLADALLRAIGVDVLDKRLEALQAVLVRREEGT